MGAAFLPVAFFTLLWGIVGIALPFVVPKSPNRGILQLMLMLTAFTCWLFWLTCYMAQMNPLIGPKLSNATIFLMAREWVSMILVPSSFAYPAAKLHVPSFLAALCLIFKVGCWKGLAAEFFHTHRMYKGN